MASTTRNIKSAPVRRRRCWLALTVLVLFGCGANRDQERPSDQTGAKPDIDAPPTTTSEVARSSDWFADWTAASGVDFRYSTGREAQCFTILETVGGGAGVVDFDLDGRPDLFCVGGGTIDPVTSVPQGSRCGLFRNLDGVRFRDITSSAQLAAAKDYSHGCVSGDLNRDGFPDLFVTCYGQNCLLLNQGDGTFLDASESAGLLSAPMWSTAAALGDVNRDGELDLYIAGYVDWKPSSQRPTDVPPPQDYRPVPDRLYLNTADGRFTDVTETAGIRTDGMGMGVIAADLNDDQRVDFYVANDVVENHLYLGTETFPLLETAGLSGVAFSESGRPEGSMGVDCADVDGDGLAELFTTNYEMEDNSLYSNLGAGQFRHSTVKFRLAGVGRPQVKFGTGLRDFDGDGWLDLMFVSGHVRYQIGRQPFLQPSTLCRNLEGRGFEDVTSNGGPWFRTKHAARGTATGDLDGDGGLDLVITSLTEPLVILHNQRPPERWLKVRLIGSESPRTPIGSRISLEAFGRTSVRFITSGSGYLSHSDDCQLLAVEPERALVDITVTWSSGRVERFSDLPVLAESVLVEGRGNVDNTLNPQPETSHGQTKE